MCKKNPKTVYMYIRNEFWAKIDVYFGNTIYNSFLLGKASAKIAKKNTIKQLKNKSVPD